VSWATASWATAALSAGIDGLVHPLATPAHAIALIGLALLAGRNDRNSPSAGAVIIAAFSPGLAIGLAALTWGAGETPAVDVLLAGAALCGLMAAAGVMAPVAVAAPVAFLVAFLAGVALGLDSPPDSIRLDDAAAMLIGVAGGSLAALAAMARAASAIARWRKGIALRVFGSWIAAIAIMALAVRWAT
jgi:urease accessory protein